MAFYTTAALAVPERRCYIPTVGFPSDDVWQRRHRSSGKNHVPTNGFVYLFPTLAARNVFSTNPGREGLARKKSVSVVTRRQRTRPCIVDVVVPIGGNCVGARHDYRRENDGK